MHTFLVVSVKGKRVATIIADALHDTIQSSDAYNMYFVFRTREEVVARIAAPAGSSVIRDDSGTIDIELSNA